jgi:hypothetical protein
MAGKHQGRPDVRLTQVVVPSLPTLLPRPSLDVIVCVAAGSGHLRRRPTHAEGAGRTPTRHDVLGDDRPAASAILGHQVPDGIVLLLGPHAPAKGPRRCQPEQGSCQDSQNPSMDASPGLCYVPFTHLSDELTELRPEADWEAPLAAALAVGEGRLATGTSSCMVQMEEGEEVLMLPPSLPETGSEGSM